LPTTDPAALGAWFREAADSGSLERYLRDLRPHRGGSCRPAKGSSGSPPECAEDLAADGVVYAEIRYAPEQHLQAGLTLDQVVEAVDAGFREG